MPRGFNSFALIGTMLLVGGVAPPGGCAPSSSPRALGESSERRVIRETPVPLRGTIGAQARDRGLEPMLVSGYGVVVGLNGTGSADVPGPVRAILEREMTRLGVGLEVGSLRDITPTEMLNDPNTAVVLVQAFLAPGLPKSSTFDVEVRTLPGTSARSLEGGRLYTAELFPGLVRPAAPATQPIAEAHGPIFINPFVEPGDPNTPITRTVGRILDGGRVIQPRLVTLDLDAPSHARSRAIADAINARFPRARGAPAVAIGRNEETIELNIPRAYRDDVDEFMQLLLHTRVDQSFPEQAAVRYVRAIKDSPELAESLAWCLQSLGQVAVPYLRELYDYPEEIPRQAAVVSGAKLADMAVLPHLEQMITIAPEGLRPRLIALLGDLGLNPSINLTLRELLDDDEYSVRIAAFEALRKRRDPWVRMHGMDDKFIVFAVPSAHPMVYVTLAGEPTVVLFGATLEINRPVFVAAWNGRLMLRANETDRDVKIFYRDHRTERATTGASEPKLVSFIEYLAHKTTPEEPTPGLDLSYSEVVGALSELCERGGVGAIFVSDLDRFALDLERSRQTRMTFERPELSVASDPEAPAAGSAAATEAALTARREASPTGLPAADLAFPESRPRRTYVVPLGPSPAQTEPDDSDG